ncbi:pseudouridine synthase [Arthrobacter antioxidans]|uniref:pseudouridine synthase n=1 Tax=Arthrobacter antioxidans TaxID=2895818 RepID=UPI001FFF7E08|nr:pseudouridine synthase [Arthrobacter antioxidans]
MTQQPGSGSGRNTPRRGGSAGRPSDAARTRKSAPRTGSGQGGGRSGEGRPFQERSAQGGRQGESRPARDDTRSSGGRPSRDDTRSSGGRPSRDDTRSSGGRPSGAGDRRDAGDRRESAEGRARSAAGRPSAGTPSSRFGTKAGGRATGKPGRPGGATGGRTGEQKSAARQKPAGAKPFGRERFGQNLGPVRVARPKRSSRPADEIDVHNPEGVRLQKVMALAGVASRRVCEEMILDGRVEVDGTVVTELGVRVAPEQVAIHVDGIRLQLDENLKYYVFNKPRGVVSTMEDPEGRPCISDFLKNKNKNERLFHVGRLDAETEGLLLLTNDGELTNRLTHPSYEVPKTYLVQVRGPMGQGIGAQMKAGIELEDGTAKVDSFKLVDSTPGHILVEVVLHSGRNRVVRRLFDAVGHPVERLVRTQLGPIRVGDQRQGSIRVLGRQEVGHLLASVGL